jgi:C-terminal lipocalin-like domain
MTVRTVVLSSALLLASVPAHAQGPAGPPPTYQQLVAQIGDLQARVAKLEGHIVASDLVGTYSLLVMDTAMSAFHPGVPPVPATISTNSTNVALTLNADGTGTANLIRCESATLTQGTWSLTGNSSCGSSTQTGVTWTYANGVSSITFLDENGNPDHNGPISFTVALGGRLLVLGGSPFHPSDPSSDHLLFLATRLR